MAEVDYRQSSDTTLTMPNGQQLNVQRFTVNNQPWVIYPGKTPTDGGTPLYVGTDGTNYQFYTYGPEDGYRLYQYHPAPGSPEDEKNLSKSQEVHTRAYGNDKLKKQFGGTMNYTSYLQGGGSMVQTLIEKVMQSQGQDQSALQQLVELAKEGNEEAIAFLQEIQGQSASMKCGGRVKKKALGSKLIKTQKAKCGCELKKVGGRLIEVDSCTGLPVHRNGGGIAKLQTAWGTIPNFSMPYNPEAHRDPLLDNIIKTSANKKKEAEEALAKERNEKQATERAVFDGSFMAGGINYGRQNPLNLARTAMQNTTIPSYIITNLSTVKQPDTTVTEETTNEQTNVKQESPKTNQQYTPLFSGDLRSYGARRQWVTDNAEYLKSQGWDDARIAGYKGSASDNIALQKAISNKSAWDAAREQRLREPIPGEQKLNRISTTLRNPAAPRPYNALPTSAITSWTQLEPKQGTK